MKKILYILIIPFLLISCDKDEEESVFQSTSDERVDSIIKEYKDALESAEHGWKTVYFPNDDKYGGYTYIMDFSKANGEVSMYSDIQESATSTSTYRFQQQQEPSLIFDTYGVLHILSDPINGVRGEGFQGEFEFYFREISEDKIVLSGKLHGEKMVLTRANLEDRDVLDEGYHMASKVFGDPKNSVFRNIEINNVPICSFSFTSNGRAVDLTYVEDGKIVSVTVGVGLDSEGFFFNEPVKIGEASLLRFNYDEESSSFVEEDASALLVYSDVPGAPLAPYPFGEEKDNGRYNYFEPGKSSLAWIEFYDAFVAAAKEATIEVEKIYLRGLMDSENPQIFQVHTNYGVVEYTFNYEIKTDGKVYFTLTGESNAPAFTPYLQPLLDVMLGSEKGYYIKDTGGLLQYSNGTFSLINADNPAIEINFYDF